MKNIIDALNVIKKNGLYPEIKTISGPSNLPQVNIGGKKYSLFCSANYLGLANDPKVNDAVIRGIKEYGIHPTGSRLISGTLDIHRELETKIAAFKRGDDAILFTTGTMANIGIIPAIFNIPTTSLKSKLFGAFSKINNEIFSDELNHATIIDGCRLAKNTKITVYNHCDINDLRQKLKASKKPNRLIVTDGVFSMDGDIVPLPEILNLAEEFSALLMIDDAHATGVLGKHGGGSADFFDIHQDIDLNVGTFSKAFGILGGFVVGEKEMIEYLRIMARTYVFTGAFPGALCAGILESLRIIQEEPWRREKLIEKSDYFRGELQRMGFNTCGSQTPIIPILIGDEQKGMSFADDLFENGILCPVCRWPAVPKGKSRIRFSIIYPHTEEQINHVLTTTKKLGKKYKLI